MFPCLRTNMGIKTNFVLWKLGIYNTQIEDFEFWGVPFVEETFLFEILFRRCSGRGTISIIVPYIPNDFIILLKFGILKLRKQGKLKQSY